MVESPVVHEEKLKLLHVVHEELQEAVGEDVPGALVGSCTEKKYRHTRCQKRCQKTRKEKKRQGAQTTKLFRFYGAAKTHPNVLR